ncbi:hypothetical protein [Streptomyces sp. CBMA156]|uniref:hypothetical protein n=1 Tax=Streptomyces sp. CBMA156 TaxID=1930280 RepID=UPI001662115B|nr:hypothetical protein [Streptomyces sp. CBMA156]MBD0672640.1 hypothetical protein [Streptomyces sp. CBMA156]
MISLSFSVPGPDSPWWSTWDEAKHLNPEAITETALRYKYFSVGAELAVGGAEFVSGRSFVPLVDLALSLAWVADRLAGGEEAAFGFTERAEVIRLRPAGDLVRVSSSAKPVEASAERTELLAKLAEFVDAAYARLIEEIPGLVGNPTIRRLDRTAGR